VPLYLIIEVSCGQQKHPDVDARGLSAPDACAMVYGTCIRTKDTRGAFVSSRSDLKLTIDRQYDNYKQEDEKKKKQPVYGRRRPPRGVFF
jgi:hypothetical protein